jgi:hypothetical protein
MEPSADFNARVEREIAEWRKKCPFSFVKQYVRFVLLGEKIQPLTPEEKAEKLAGFVSSLAITDDDRTDEEKAFDEEGDAIVAEMLDEPDAVQSWRSLVPEENLPSGPYICAIHFDDVHLAETEEKTKQEQSTWPELIEAHVRRIFSWAASCHLHLPYMTLGLPEELIHEKLRFDQGGWKGPGNAERHALLVNRRDILVVEHGVLGIGYDFYVSQ